MVSLNYAVDSRINGVDWRNNTLDLRICIDEDCFMIVCLKEFLLASLSNRRKVKSIDFLSI